MTLELGILKSFTVGTYRAEVQLMSSLTTYLDAIPVSVAIAQSALSVGNRVLVAIPGGHIKDAVVIATWPGGTPPGGGGATTFLGLTDTPSSYSGQEAKFPKVAAGEAALDFGLIYDILYGSRFLQPWAASGPPSPPAQAASPSRATASIWPPAAPAGPPPSSTSCTAATLSAPPTSPCSRPTSS
jgi:hypothetical protein